MTEFNLRKFLIDVFNPQADEQVLVMIDLPHDDIKDNDDWKDRREMAKEWREKFISIGEERGFDVYPILTYEATGVGGAKLPEFGEMNNEKISFEDIFKHTTLLIALNEFSATGPLANFAMKLPKFRGASMPLVSKSMEKTGLAADYKAIQERCAILKGLLDSADAAEVVFSTGHSCLFDLRHRDSVVDDGKIDQSIFGKGMDAILNLPGGETLKVPYEGEIENDESMTKGELAVKEDGDLVVFVVEKNKVVEIRGDGGLAKYWREYIEIDKGRRNIAEFAFGCNEMADPNGYVIEAEKAGFHWALGESDHLGGVFTAEHFDDSANSSHHDFTYAGKNEVVVQEAVLIGKDGGKTLVMKDGKYVI